MLLSNTSPLNQIKPHIIQLWKAHHTDKEILQEVQRHINTNQYGIGLTSLRVICKDLSLYGTHQQGAMVELRQIYPNAGMCEMISLLFHEQQIINDIWAMDQHDKWLHYGLTLHTGIEPFSGKILWIQVWHLNHNPQLILMYFLDIVEELDIPLVTQSDPGTENFGIANAQSMLCQWHDPELVSMLQHRWMQHKKNITPEIMWSQLWCHFTPGFETILKHGVKEGWLVFCWLFIPWLQKELMGYQDHVNNTAKQHDHNKILPHGIPNLIYESAGDYDVLDFKVKVDLATIKHIQKLYIKPTHTVFDLVPPAFSAFMEECYVHMGCPSVTCQNVWAIYHGLCSMIWQHADALTMLKSGPSV
ncbi:hypothetical protein EDC04DRAFT_2868507 [Pisolithus marmoratus]|nr:hypothetical protein EDC04DRAFT_2868507 [Pisolithus marmoratus]